MINWFIVVLLISIALISWLGWRVWQYKRIIRNERILNYFATSLYGRNSEEDIFWDIAKNCIAQLGLEDCVIYRYDAVNQVLIQKAAYGPKNPDRHEILNPILIPLGQGITGYVAKTRQAIMVADTRKDSRYIIDDEHRLSELAVPILSEHELIGVIDSEHSAINFFQEEHLNMLTRIAKICGAKIRAFNTETRVRDHIARDLHDELGSTLTSINIMSKIAQKLVSNEDMRAYFEKINLQSKTILENMSDIVWSINPHNDTLDKLILRVRELLNELLEPCHINYHFELKGQAECIRLNPHQRKEVFLIFKEAITNLVKHSQATHAFISIDIHANEMYLLIRDNGTCESVPTDCMGNGLNNMRMRAGNLGGTIHFRVQVDQPGLEILLHLPITPSGYSNALPNN